MKDLHKIWKHRWTNPKVKYYNSKIHGLGTVAMGRIKRGETVIVLGGVIVPNSDIKRYRKLMGRDLGINIDKDFWICPPSWTELRERGGAINHSCEPNIGTKNRIIFLALRNIKKGEEITADYASIPNFNFKSFKCNCRSKSCKGLIKPNKYQ